MIPSVSYGFFHHRGNVVPVQAFIFHLRSFKRGVRDNPYSAYAQWLNGMSFALAS